MTTRRPLARSDELIIEELEDEVLVFDKKNNRAHCLSGSAARVWRACDGSSDPEMLAEALDLDVDTVSAAFDELESAELFERGLEVFESNGNGNGNGHGITRRQLGKRSAQVGGAVMAAPLILSITAPTALATATPPNFFCEIFTTGACGASTGCGSIAGCCCCNSGCPGAGSCKACSSVATCTTSAQPCAGSPDLAQPSCSDAKGTNPFTKCGCCGPPFYPNIGSANQGCGCGWGNLAPVDANGVSTSGFSTGTNPGAGCCDISSTGPGPGQFVKCFQASSCVPCCNGIPIGPPITVNGVQYNQSPGATTTFGCCGGYNAPNAATDTCGHTLPPGYVPSDPSTLCS